MGRPTMCVTIYQDFSIILQHGSMVSMVADDLAMQGAKASAAMVFTWLSQDTLVSALWGDVYSLCHGNIFMVMIKTGVT